MNRRRLEQAIHATAQIADDDELILILLGYGACLPTLSS
jgi:hypothetical protein